MWKLQPANIFIVFQLVGQPQRMYTLSFSLRGLLPERDLPAKGLMGKLMITRGRILSL